MARQVKITVTRSSCRDGFHKKGQEYILTGDTPACPPICMELWHYAYPYVWALMNGADLDNDDAKAKSCEVCCPDECRVHLLIECVETQI